MKCKNCQGPVTAQGEYRHCENCGWFKVDGSQNWKRSKSGPPSVTHEKDIAADHAAEPDPATTISDEKPALSENQDSDSDLPVTHDDEPDTARSYIAPILFIGGVLILLLSRMKFVWQKNKSVANPENPNIQFPMSSRQP